MSLKVDRGRRPGLGISSKCGTSSLPKYGYSVASKELKDVLERKIEDLSRQLAEERQAARRDKMQTSRLQRELARHKTDKPGKEGLSRELERERMLRIDAEHRLHEMTKESDGCRSRLQNLQEEFKKMEELVQNMVQYKTKIDQLKQEKTSLSVTYENNLHKFGTHISDLERENMMLLNEVKKLESQISNKTDGRDRSKLLLERLRMLEGENSSLVLENEQQRQQYEKCLDEIANQVVQALLAQKMLREECLKLQNRVRDLELQNRQLCVMFQQRIKCSTEAAQQVTIQQGDTVNHHEVYIEGSMESIQSMFSEQMSEHLAVPPSMSSPPPWLQERLSLPGDRLSIVSISGSIQSTPDFTEHQDNSQSEFSCRTKIETEFPATPSSPKVKHINVFERKQETKRSSSVSSLTSSKPNKVRTRSTSSLSRAKGLSLFNPSSVSPVPVGQSQNSVSKQGKSARSKSHGELTNSNASSTVSANQGKGSKANIQSEMTNSSSSNHAANHNQRVPSPPKSGQNLSVAASNHNSQGQQADLRTQTSKIPVHHTTSSPVKEPAQPRRKSDSGIKMGNQALMGTKSVNQSTTSSSSKLPQYSSRSSSADSGHHANAGSRIPTVSKNSVSGVKNGPQEKTTPQSKLKPPSVRTSMSKPIKTASPSSPVPKLLSGIKTSVRDDNSRKAGNSVSNMQNGHSDLQAKGGNPVSAVGTTTVYSNGPVVGSSRIPTINGTSDWHIRENGETHSHSHTPSQYPRMGYTSTHVYSSAASSASESSVVYSNTNGDYSGVTKSDLSYGRGDNCYARGDNSLPQGQTTASQLPKGQYFYDYSDEDSDFNRPVSKDFSVASTVSLDELLDETLENIETPLDSDFTTETFFLLNSSHITNLNNKLQLQASDRPGLLNGKEEAVQLQGKPDIVKDTEKCERQNLKKTLTVSHVPTSGSAGYRARRPKSLILDGKDKQILLCEYDSSAESDTSSDEEWSYQYSYAKNIKHHELQSKISKSQKTEVDKNRVTKEVKVHVENEQNDKSSKSLSQIPRPKLSKMPIKTPPPVARKPLQKKSSPVTPPDPNNLEFQKSVDICVNTMVTQESNFSFMSNAEPIDSGNYKRQKSSKIPSFKETNHSIKVGMENPECKLDSVKVERSGSKDDGYSTMSSDVQPEVLEKYSDACMSDRKDETFEMELSKTKDTCKSKGGFDVVSDPDSALESSTHSNDIRNSNLSLSSQNSFSSEERQHTHGSLGRVRAMKMKFEVEAQKQSPERDQSPPKSPLKSPVSPPRSPIKTPPKSPPKPPKPVKNVPLTDSRIPFAINSKIPVSSGSKPSPKPVQISSAKPHLLQSDSEKLVHTLTPPLSDYKEKAVKEFNEMSYFMPTLEQISFLRDRNYDSSSSASERGSDLTSLHISEDNILSDIPEEKDEYESSVEKQSEAPSVSSLKLCQKFKFQMTLKRHWRSMDGLTRAKSASDIEKQRLAKESADYDEMYGGSLNMDTPLERSASMSDMYGKGDNSKLKLSPRLQRSHCGSLVDEMAVEEQVQIILKQQLLQQFSQSANTRVDSDIEDFSALVDELRQKGHLMDSQGQGHPKKKSMSSRKQNQQQRPDSSSSSSKGHNSYVMEKTFELEERQIGEDVTEGPVGEEKKKFNSQFYSLCDVGHVGSNPSISSVNVDVDKDTEVTGKTELSDLQHTCQKGDENCKRCIEDSNSKDFDEISRQIENLSKTVNSLHHSLSSLNSDNSDDSGSESNEGDQSGFLTSAIGNKEIDGYQWVEDEFFLSPYGGELILGTSPFSDTGASCDWMNEYMEDGAHSEEQYGEREAMHEEPAGLSQFVDRLKNNRKHAKTPIRPHESSILVGAIDKEGNFDSHEFISRRLKQEEERLQAGGVPKELTFDLEPLRSRIGSNYTSTPLKLCKEDLHTTPEKDIDDTLHASTQKRANLIDSLLYGNLGDSQDSLDDNIGVDHVMCHRLLGKNEVHMKLTNSRPSVELSPQFYTRYGDQEKQAVAAFDFLQEMSTSASSCDQSRSALSRKEETKQRRNRRKLRPKQKRDKQGDHSGRLIKSHGAGKESSTSPDSPNDASCDEISFSDTCADSYSSSSPSLPDTGVIVSQC